MVDLGTLGGRLSIASDINELGHVAGINQTHSGDIHAFLWTPEQGMISLPGAVFNTLAVAINERDQLVGTLEVAPRVIHARLWTVVGLLEKATPTISAGGVVDAARFGPTLAPGGIASLFGVDLAADVAAATNVPLATSFGGVRVQMNGVDAPLFFVSPNQINLQVPFEVPFGGNVPVVVIREDLAGPAVEVAVAEFAPGLFMNPATGEAIVQRHPDGTLI